MILKIKNQLFILFVVLIISACKPDQMTFDKTNNNTLPDSAIKKDVKYLALGDSYTIGHAVESDERFPEQLVEFLKAIGVNTVHMDMIAKTGWTTGELLEAIDNQNPNLPYDLVTLCIGVNNQYRKLDTAEYRKELRRLLNMSISFTAGSSQKVIAFSIPDYGVTPFGQNLDPDKIAMEIDAFNTIKNEEALKYSVEFIDITPKSRMAQNNPELIADDGLHPSGKMYAEWVELIKPIVLKLLKDQHNK